VLDFIKNCLNFLFFKELKIKRIIIEKLEKMQPSLKTKKKRKEKEWIVGAMLELHCHQALLIKEDPPR
jgi:hypothetical protein